MGVYDTTRGTYSTLRGLYIAYHKVYMTQYEEFVAYYCKGFITKLEGFYDSPVGYNGTLVLRKALQKGNSARFWQKVTKFYIEILL